MMDHEIQQKIDSIMANMAEMRRSLQRYSEAAAQTTKLMLRLEHLLSEEHS